MHLSTIVFTVLTLATTALSAGLNNTREYYLRSQLKPNQTDKYRFNNLSLVAYHTGAGLGLAAEFSTPSSGWFYLNSTDTSLLWTYEGSAGPWPVEWSYSPYAGMSDLASKSNPHFIPWLITDP